MKVFWSIDDAQGSMTHGALAMGNFDGVHRGHQALIKKARMLARGAPHGVLTFTPHPARLLHRSGEHQSIMTDREKIAALRRHHVDVAILHTINEDFLKLSPEAFVRDFLVARLAIKNVVVGDDFTFGNAARGDTALLASLGNALGFHTEVIPPVLVDGERCSSTAIRNYLRNGLVVKANAMLDRPFSFSGTVVVGEQLGRSIGFKTANLIPPAGFVLASGIYATVTRVADDEGEKDFLSATSVGYRPTVTDEKNLVVETHIFDHDRDLYGKEIRIFFIEHLRSEEKFASLNELQEQIAQDCARVRELHRSIPTRFQIKD